MNEQRVIKVRITNPAGDFLALQSGKWGFTPDQARAAVFDYVDDHVAEQLEIIQKTQGFVLTPVPLDPGEYFETCDKCEREVLPFMVFFDGKQFLCADCRNTLGLDDASLRI